MKPKKWERLGIGLCLLLTVVFFPGTDPFHCAGPFCPGLEEITAGYLEVHNNTPYNIMVLIEGTASYGPFKITGNPSYLRTLLPGDMYLVAVFVCTPTPDQQPVFYKRYVVVVPDDMTVETLTVTTPLGYIPVPKK